MSEHAEQVALMQWFKLQHPKLIMFSIPNGAHLAGDNRLRAIKMNNMKAEGLIAGVSDLFLMMPTIKYHGLFIEMKVKGGKVSDNQKVFINNAILIGYQSIVCYGFEQAKNAINEYLQENKS